MSTFANRGGHPIAGEHAQEEMGAGDQGLVKDDGAEPGYRADDNTEHGPLLEVRGRDHPPGRSGREGPHPHGATGFSNGLRGHRSQPELQSCSGTSPAAVASRPSA
jgi:hypothetical protein